jgi:hypothetical protein
MSIGSVDKSFSAYERLVITGKKLRPDLELVFINTCSLQKSQGVNNIIKFVAAHYDLPVVSYADLVLGLAEISGQADLPKIYWGNTDWVHPPWVVHQLIGETV